MGTRLTLSTPLRKSRHEVSARVGEEIALLQTVRGEYFSLNQVGGRVWELLDEVPTLDEVGARIVLEYDAEPQQVQRDLMVIAQELLDAGLLEVAG